MSKENNTKLSGMDPAVYQKQLLRFLFYTFLGCLVFFCPVKQGDSTNIVFGVITDFLKGLLGDFGVYLIIAIALNSSRSSRLSAVMWQGIVLKGSSRRLLF